jgi:D-3-phosphoglycerate dehydrogenase
MGDSMRYVHCLNKISPVGLKTLPKGYELSEKIDDASAILVRSAVMHELNLPVSVKVVARAGAGVNNIPLDRYAKEGVVVFNTPGANANAVKEIIIAGMLLASRDIIGGVNWVQDNKHDSEVAKSIEKIKSQFGGTEIKGKTIGIFGLGAIGMNLAKTCVALGMKVVGLERNLAIIDRLDIPENMVLADTKEELFPQCDFISLNIPLLPDTKHILNKEAFDQMKDGVIILNFARDGLVQDDDLEQALISKRVRSYVTDFPNTKTAAMKGVIAIPHLGASTEEAEDNCAMMAIQQMVDYLDNGNLYHSVNFPDASLSRKNGHRITVLSDGSVQAHEIIAKINTNEILDHVVRANEKYQTMIFETRQKLDQDVIKTIKELSGVFHIHLS